MYTEKLRFIGILILLCIGLFATWGSVGGARELEGEIYINLTSVVEPGQPDPWQAVADAYMKLHPKVKVYVDNKPSQGYWEFVRAQFATGVPKASLVHNNGVLDLVNQGKFVDFAPYFSKINPYTKKPWGEGFDAGKTQRYYGPFGECWWLGFTQTRAFMVYNKGIFNKLGLKPPKTWNELLNISAKIKAAGYIPAAFPGDYQSLWAGTTGGMFWLYADQYTRSLINICRAQPGDWNFKKGKDDVWKYDPTDPWNDDADKVTVNWARLLKGIRDGIIRFDTPAWEELYTNLHRFFPKYVQPGFFATTEDEAYILFLRQKAAMYRTSQGFITRFARDVASYQPFEYGLFNFPSMTGKYVQAPARSWEGTTDYIAVPVKDQKQNELEIDFLMFYSSPQGYQKYMDASISSRGGLVGLPIIKGVQIPPDELKKWKPLIDLPLVGSVQGDTKISARIGRGLWDDQESTREFVRLLTEYFNDKITVREFCKGYQKLMVDAVPRVAEKLGYSMEDLSHPERRPRR